MIQEKTLICKDCSKSFVFTAEEQEFFQKKGFTNEPGRCPSCRQERRNSGSGSARGAGSSYGRSDRQMYTATCAQCGKEARVPFEPRSGRPVYCSDCFSTRNASTRSY